MTDTWSQVALTVEQLINTNHHGISPPSYFPTAFSHPGTWIFTALPFISGVASRMILMTSFVPTSTSKSPSPPRSVFRCWEAGGRQRARLQARE